MSGLNPDLYDKLALELDVAPPVLEFRSCSRGACYFGRRWYVLTTMLLEGELCRENFRTAKEILKNPRPDGYILIDSRIPQTSYDLVLAHEFVHAHKRKKKMGSKFSELHTIDEVEADVISAVLLIKNGLDPIKSISDYISYLEAIPKKERFFSLAPLWRFMGLAILLGIINMVW